MMDAPPFRIGILGCANVGPYALFEPVKYVPGLNVSGIAGRNPIRTHAYAAQHGIPRVFTDYASLVESPDIDVVYVALPNSHHCEWTIEALKHRKAVLCEKPIACNEHEAKRMAIAADSYGQPLIEAVHFRYHPLMMRVGQLMRDAALGRIIAVNTHFLVPRFLISDDDIRFQYHLGGGAAMDPGAYCVNLLRFLVGAEPEVVEAKAELVAPEVDGVMRAILRFPDGIKATMKSSLMHTGTSIADFDMWLRVEGDKGTLTIRNPFFPQLPHTFTIETAAGVVAEQFESTPSYVFQARALLAVLRRECLPLTSGADGVLTMRVVDSIYRAAGLQPRCEGTAGAVSH